MELQELLNRSRNSQRRNAHTSCSLETVTRKVGLSPGHTAYWHYERTVSRSYAYAAFARAEKHGLIQGIYANGKTTYTVTNRGREYLVLAGHDGISVQ